MYIFNLSDEKIFIPSVFFIIYIVYFLSKNTNKYKICNNNINYLIVVFFILFISGSFLISFLSTFNVLTFLESQLYLVFASFCIYLLCFEKNTYKYIIVFPFILMLLVIGKKYNDL